VLPVAPPLLRYGSPEHLVFFLQLFYLVTQIGRMLKFQYFGGIFHFHRQFGNQLFPFTQAHLFAALGAFFHIASGGNFKNFPNFLLDGGDALSLRKGAKEIVMSDIFVRDGVVKYIKDKSEAGHVFNNQRDGRIVIKK
jgi:hypothetical protein